MKKVKLLNLGGKITSIRNPETGNLQSGRLTVGELIKQSHFNFPTLALDIEDFLSIPGPEITLQDLKGIKGRLEEIIAEDTYSGIVITQGTDTLEETAYMLDLLVEVKIPIVMTGSQRNIEDFGFDGIKNIEDAIIVASEKESRGKGLLVVFNQEIIPAKLAFKSNSSGLRGFTAQGTGPLGNVYGVAANYYYDYSPKNKLEVSNAPFSNRVYLFKMTMDYPTDIIEFAIENNCDGLVIEGFGVGEVFPEVQDLLEQAILKGIPVVLTTRSNYGGVHPVYDTKGAGASLKEIGVIFESDISGVKARLKLIALLNSPFKDEIEKYWDEY